MSYQQPHPQGSYPIPQPYADTPPAMHQPQGSFPPPQGYAGTPPVMQQPEGYAGTPPVVHQPSAGPVMSLDAGLPRDASGQRDWKHGLFGCFDDCGTCCVACWCPCITFAQNKSRYEHLERNNGRPHPEGGESCNGDCFMHGALTAFCGLGWIFQIGSRSNTRRRYGIRGNGCNDCMAAFCCNPCELTQESLEIEEEEMSNARAFGGPVSEKPAKV